MKVLVVSHSANTHGAEMALLRIIDELRSACPIEFMIVLPQRGVLEVELARRRLPYRVIPYGPWVRSRDGRSAFSTLADLGRGVSATRRIQELVRELSADVVLTNTLAVPWGALAASLADVPHVWFAHEYMDLDHGLEFDLGRANALAMVGRLSSLVIANSQALAAHLSPWMPETSVEVCYIPVALTMTSGGSVPVGSPFGVDFHGLKVAVVGRIRPSKGQLDLVRAIPLLAKRGIDVEVCLIGRVEDPEYVSRMWAELEHAGLRHRLILIDHSDEALALAAYADVCCTTSVLEAFGQTTVEYMLLGKPVIGADSGATPEIVQDGRTGLIYQQGNSEELAECLSRYAQESNLATVHGANGRQIATDLDSGAFGVGRLGDLLQEVGSPRGLDAFSDWLVAQGEWFSELAPLAAPVRWQAWRARSWLRGSRDAIPRPIKEMARRIRVTSGGR